MLFPILRLVQLENGCTVSIILELENLDNITFRCINAVRSAGGRVQSFQVSDSQLGNKYALIIAETGSDEVSLAELESKLQQVRGVKKVTILR